jgi:hypothetical protein
VATVEPATEAQVATVHLLIVHGAPQSVTVKTCPAHIGSRAVAVAQLGKILLELEAQAEKAVAVLVQSITHRTAQPELQTLEAQAAAGRI